VRKAMNNLSPAGQRFAKFLFGLKGDFQKVQFAAEQGLLPGLQRGLQALLPFLPKISSLVGNVGKALGDTFVEFIGSLKDPVWQRFFSYIGDTAVPALRGMLQVANNLARGVAGLLVALSPFNERMGKGLIDLSEGFARWAETLDQNSGFQKFLAYVGRVGPKVVDLLEQLAIFVGRLVAAAAPVGEIVLKVFTGLFDAINKLPLPILSAIVTGIAALATAMLFASAVARGYAIAIALTESATKLWGVAMALVRAEMIVMTAVQRVATTVMSLFGSTAQAQAARTAVFGRAMTALQTASSTVRNGLSSIVGFLGGPWGIALAVASLALFNFINAQNEAKSTAHALASAMQQVASAFKEGGDAAVIALSRQDASVAQLVTDLKQYGVTAQDVFNAQNGDVDAQQKVMEALTRQIDDMTAAVQKLRKEQGSTGIAGQFTSVGDDEFKAIDAKKKLLEELRDQFKSANAAQKEYGQTADEVAAEQQRNTIATRVYGQQIEDLETVYAELTGKTQDASATGEAFRKVIQNNTGAAVTATEAEEQYTRSLLDLRAQLQANGGELDIHKGKTDDQTRAILSNRDALEDALRAAREKTLADIEAKVPIDEATKASQARIDEILKEIPATQRNSAVVKELVDRYGDIPGSVKTKLSTEGAEKVLEQLKDLKVAQYALEHDLTIAAARAALAKDLNTFESQVPAQARAGGGYISGPGGPTEDKIPAWLSNGEYVIPAWLVSRLGVGFFDRLLSTKSRMLQGGHGDASPGFSGGGPVTFPMVVDSLKTKIPFTLDELRQQYASQGVTPGGLGWQKMIDLLRAPFPNLTLLSGLRPGAVTVTGNKSYHAVGRAVDVPPRRDVFGWIHNNYPASRELIYTPMGGDQIWNGHPHVFSAPVAAEHYDHVHWAYDQGGYLPPGMSTVYNGTGSPEPVLTSRQWRDISALAAGAGQPGGNTYNFEFADTTLTPGRLRALQDRDAILARSGRAR
jgi:type II secretory pathway pseudopilin PulG